MSRYSQSKLWFQTQSPRGFCSRFEAQPVGNQEEVRASGRISSASPEVVISQSELGDGDGVVLQADMSVIVELGNTGGVVGALVVGLLGKEHVVFAEFVGCGVRIVHRSLMPKGEVALAAQKIGAEDATVVGETRQLKFSGSIHITAEHL